MLNWKELAREDDAQLGSRDLIEVNLASTEGLPGRIKPDAELCRSSMPPWADGWATR